MGVNELANWRLTEWNINGREKQQCQSEKQRQKFKKRMKNNIIIYPLIIHCHRMNNTQRCVLKDFVCRSSHHRHRHRHLLLILSCTPMQWNKEKDAPNLTLHTDTVSIKSIQRDIMALNKPASYDMIVINESAFVATIATISINREWARYKKASNAHLHTFTQKCMNIVNNTQQCHCIESNVIVIV